MSDEKSMQEDTKQEGSMPIEDNSNEMNGSEEIEEKPEPEDFKPKKEKEGGEDIVKDPIKEIEQELEKEDVDLGNIDNNLEELDNAISEDIAVEDAVVDTEKQEDDGSDKVEGKDVVEDEKIKANEEELEKVDKELKEVDEDIEKAVDVDNLDETQQFIDELKEDKNKEAPKKEEEKKEEPESKGDIKTHIYALRTTANREDQVMDFITSNAERKGFKLYSVIRAHGMRGYIFVEADSRTDAEQAAYNVPYARGILPKEINYTEIEHMLEQVKKEVNIQQNDIVEIISGPFKRENARIIRIDKGKEEVVVELLEAAVPIPITLRLDSVKVIRRETEEE